MVRERDALPMDWGRVEKGNLAENELLVGNYLWEWPKMNYRRFNLVIMSLN